MKICYVNPDLGIRIEGEKGAAAHMRGLIAAFRAAGCAVEYVAPTAEAGDIPAPEPGLFAGLSAAPPKRVARALRHIWANAGVERALLDRYAAAPPDLIYERYGPFAVAGGIAAERLGVSHILEVNAPLAREGAEYRNQALGEAAEALERSAFETAGAIVAVSAELKAELVEYGVDPAKVHVLPNGVDTARFTPDGPAETVDADGAVTFGFVGGLRPWHGIADMAAAFRLVAEELDARLLVVGDGPERKHLVDLARDLPGRVATTGAVSHERAPALLRAVDVALAPYPPLERFYYSPLKILEYMAAGRAIIASRIGQTSLLLEDGAAGLLTPPGDVPALADAMRRLANDPALRVRLAARARASACSQHDWSARAAQILSLVGGAPLTRSAAVAEP